MGWQTDEQKLDCGCVKYHKYDECCGQTVAGTSESWTEYCYKHKLEKKRKEQKEIQAKLLRKEREITDLEDTQIRIEAQKRDKLAIMKRDIISALEREQDEEVLGCILVESTKILKKKSAS